MDALELLNGAIRESGVDLDSLTTLEWASPPERMHERFKEWVDQAWQDIQVERQNWEFMQRNGMTLISPRLHVINGTSDPAAASTYLCSESAATFTSVGTEELLSGTWAAGTANAYIDIYDVEGSPVLNEEVDRVLATPLATVFTIKGWGRYDLDSIFSDLLQANSADFYIQSPANSSISTNTGSADSMKLNFIPWAEWNDHYEAAAWSGRGRPYAMTKTPEGHYDFFPRPDQQYVLKVSYTATPDGFVDDADIPALPSPYHPAILWRAVMYYADYEHQPAVLARAERRYKFYKRLLDRNLKPRFTMPRNRYDG